MDERTILEEFNKDLYDLQKRYLYIPLNDYLWEHFLREQTEIRDKYKQYGGKIDKFVRSVLVSLAEFKEGKGADNDNKDKKD